VLVVEDFDTVVCCETVVACVEPEVCDCVVSGLVLLLSHVDLMFCQCVLLDEAMASWENFCLFSRGFFFTHIDGR
jgi:hypothetical protein